VTRTIASHEAELEAAVERAEASRPRGSPPGEDNLQVVASLLNLTRAVRQARTSAAAYASIQRRVDALAVVHRNHYAELRIIAASL
jgi:hypothetical protein